ncbi:MAG: MFS transporter [Alphaproteobacteria bacterium]|jgi:acyl-[acyl-carrier-protein]-phospholipid O-acyltransferase/long-chain-fatty-acid--[acyl-carrier-protein] ligase|nr:MFS transporter [Alphaproteobacteria bacterium]MBP9876734.1 MFS transporter [Alphaproteobacteria bacterium]
MSVSQFSLLKTRRFLPLFIVQFLTAFNDNAFKNAFLIWFTYDLVQYSTISAPVMVNIAAALFIVPFFLFSSIAGQLADRFDKAILTRYLKYAEIILMILAAACFYFKTVTGLLIVLFFLGVQATLFGPIKYSLLPEQLKDNELIAGNAFIEGGTFLAILLGTIFGGLLVMGSFGREAIAITLILFATIGLITSYSMPLAKKRQVVKSTPFSWNIVTGTMQIIAYSRETKTVFYSIIGISWFWLVGIVFLSQFPIYVKDVLHADEVIVTLLLTIFSLGIGIGSLLCNRLLDGKIDGKMVPYGALGMTLFIFLFTLGSHFYKHTYVEQPILMLFDFLRFGFPAYLILLGLIGLAICGGIYIVPLYAIMQHRSNQAHMARVVGANNVFNALFMVIGSVGTVGLYALNLSAVEILFLVGLFNVGVFFVVQHIVRRERKHA